MKVVTRPNEPIAREVTIRNKEGLHTRPVMKFVDLAQTFTAEIKVRSLETSETVNGKSAMELMLLCATHGTVLEVQASGADAADAIDALAALVHEQFRLDRPNA